MAIIAFIICLVIIFTVRRYMLSAVYAVVVFLSVCVLSLTFRYFISARCNIYISRLRYDVSAYVRLSVTEVHWRIINS